MNMAELLECLNGSPIPVPVPAVPLISGIVLPRYRVSRNLEPVPELSSDSGDSHFSSASYQSETEELWEALRVCEEIKDKWTRETNPLSQYEDEIRAVIQDKLHLTVDLKDNESRNERLIKVLSYYLCKGYHPDDLWKKIISTIWQPVGHRRRSGYSVHSWFSFLSEILLDGGFIQTFQEDELFQLLRYYPKPDLGYSPSSCSDYRLYSELIESFATHVPFKHIHEFMTSKTDELSRTIMFYAQDFSAYISMYRESQHELQQLLLMKDLNGDTALHHNSAIFSGSALGDVFGDNHGPLYDMLSVQNKKGNTVFHKEPDLLWPFLHKMFSSEDKSALHHLILLKDTDGQTCLFKDTTSSDCMRQLLVCAYKDNIDDLFELLRVRDRHGKTVLHTKYTEILPVLKRLRKTHYSIIQKLLCEMDSEGQTALFNVRHPVFFQNLYHYRWDAFLHLLSIYDLRKQSALHSNAWTVARILDEKPNWSLKHFKRMHKLFSAVDKNGQTALFTAEISISFISLLHKLYDTKSDKLLQLLSISDRTGQTVLHINANLTAAALIIKPIISWDETHQLLSMTDDQCQTALFTLQIQHIIPLLQTTYLNRKGKLYELLSIQDKEGRTALHFNIDTIADLMLSIFDETQRESLQNLLTAQDCRGKTAMFSIKNLASISKLFMTNMDSFYELLSIQDERGQTALFVIDYFIPLLEHVHPNHIDSLHKLFSIRDEIGQTALFNPQQVKHLIPLLQHVYPNHGSKLYELLSIQDKVRRSALHSNIDPLSVIMMEAFDETQRDRLQSLLTAQDHRGQTVMFKIKDMSKISKLFTNHMGSLHSLLSIQDNTDQTALHKNLRPFTQSLVETYTPDKLYREGLKKLLNIKDSSSRTALEMNEQKEPSSFCELSWLLRQVKHNTYPLKSPPQALIVYNQKDREGAEEEAQSLTDALNDKRFNVNVLKDESKIEIMAQIVRMAKKTAKQSALVVVLMSHGSATATTDSDGEPIEYVDVEAVMCKHVKDVCNPKILIVQACRGGTNDNADNSIMDPAEVPKKETDPGQNHPEVPAARCYEPTHRNFYAELSTTSGRPSERKVFIPKLARRIQNCEEFDTLDDLVMEVTEEMMFDGYQQTPVHISTRAHRFCPGGVFKPSVGNSNNRKHDHLKDEIEILKEKISRLESDPRLQTSSIYPRPIEYDDVAIYDDDLEPITYRTYDIPIEPIEPTTSGHESSYIPTSYFKSRYFAKIAKILPRRLQSAQSA